MSFHRISVVFLPAQWERGDGCKTTQKANCKTPERSSHECIYLHEYSIKGLQHFTKGSNHWFIYLCFWHAMQLCHCRQAVGLLSLPCPKAVCACLCVYMCHWLNLKHWYWFKWINSDDCSGAGIITVISEWRINDMLLSTVRRFLTLLFIFSTKPLRRTHSSFVCERLCSNYFVQKLKSDAALTLTSPFFSSTVPPSSLFPSFSPPTLSREEGDDS